jgi:nucleotide-binding universal stress UspA family protein
MDKVIVGVDGSAGSRAALDWALDEAARWGAPLVAVEAWEFTPLAFTVEVPVRIDELRETIQQHLHQVVAEAVARRPADAPSVEVEALVVEDAVVPALLTQAGPESLIVVGSRGHGGFAGLLLGSSSQQVAHHAPCPVAIIRAPS